LITREIVESYGGVREMLERRRNVELVQAALQRQIDRLCLSNVRTGTGDIPREKVPGKDEWVIRPRGTNNPEGAALQHFEGYTEAALKHLQENDALIQHVDVLITHVHDARDRAILIDFYCNGMRDTDIAREMHYDRTTVSKRREGAIFDLECMFHASPHNSRAKRGNMLSAEGA